MRIFKETQRFNQWWMHLIMAVLVLFLLFALYQWFIVETTVGNVSASDSLGQIVVILSIVPIVLFLCILRLKTVVDEKGIHYQFFPIHLSLKLIRWNEIDNCSVRAYHPIKEYGGWGYRISLGDRGKALNIRGNQGIQIVLSNGKNLLLGTQKPKEAEETLKRDLK